MYLYHISSAPGIRDDCIEEYMTIAPNQKEAIKRFRQVLQDNNNFIGYNDQAYRPEWWLCTEGWFGINKVWGRYLSELEREGRIMTKEEILIDLINKILVDKYELHEVRRSNSNGSQEYHFVIKRPSMKENQRVGMKMNDEE